MEYLSFEEFNKILNIYYHNKKYDTFTYTEAKNFIPLVNKAVNKELTIRQKECFLMYYNKKLTIKSIANTLGISNTTAFVHIKRAKQNIYLAIKYFALPKKMWS